MDGTGDTVAQAGVQNCLGAYDISDDEILRAVNRAINVGFGRKVHDNVVAREYLI
ncbi:unannotated protein [freshwater metagenome]|uniref:Unannotated protein n=1 Tax=freshwater metagenome TaxID=449393 RepID=A0A6J6PGJ8_9ZZZZ